MKNYPTKKLIPINLDTYTKNILIIDIETIGTIYKPDTALPFDISLRVFNPQTEETYEEESLLVRKFFNNKYIMYSSFSATKYDSYLSKVETDKRYKVLSVKAIQERLAYLIRKYDICLMSAHNGAFDYTQINLLFEEFKMKSPIKKLNVIDTMEMSENIVLSEEYKNFCLENKHILSQKPSRKFITDSGRVSTKAEAIYSFIANCPEFKEEHTGLEDIAIEIEIFKKGKQTKPRVELNTNSSVRWQVLPQIAERV